MITGLVNLNLLWDHVRKEGPSGRVEDVSRLGTGPLKGSRKIGTVRGALPRCRGCARTRPVGAKNTRSMLQIHFTEIDFFFKLAESGCCSGRLRQILGEYA